MNPLHKAVDDYLELRRGFGFKLRDYGTCLMEFIRFLESNGTSRITSKLALEFATQRQDQRPVAWARRMTIVRGLPATEPALIPQPRFLRSVCCPSGHSEHNHISTLK